MNKGTLYCTSKRNHVLPYNMCHDITVTGWKESNAGKCKRYGYLSPDWNTLKKFKDAPDTVERYIEYQSSFIAQIKNSNEAVRELKDICARLNRGEDVNLTCYCTDFKKCHRFILGQMFERKGYKVVYK